MNLRIDRKKLKLRHFLNVQKECKDYSIEEDYLYELVNGLEFHDMLDTPFGISFNKYNVSVLGKDNSNEKHFEIMKDFVEKGIVKQVEGDSIRTIKYQLVRHQWMKTESL